MREAKTVGDLYDSLKGAVKEKGDAVELFDEAKLRSEGADILAYNAVFGTDEVKAEARRLIKLISAGLGIRPASIQPLYEAMGRGECRGFTVPAINIRGLTFDTARAVFRTAARFNAGPFIFEIAKSEIGYTAQRPAEYTACCLAAAIKEGYRGPVFIQGDHFQLKAKGFNEDKEKELQGLKDLIKEAVEADFYNIDIDASTLVDLSRPTVREQQEPNFETTARLTEYIRDIEPGGVTVSVGGEIGEVGGKNTTEEELKEFMEGYRDTMREGLAGISKISIQTGTSHGGVALPDGSIAKVKVDFDTIERLTREARDEYGLAGVVQHGASTLPEDAFHVFAEKGAAEVHLATGFQNIIYESEAFPTDLKDEMYKYLHENLSGERKEGDTEEQFIYKTRKKAFGPFKEKVWSIDPERKARIGAELEKQFDLLFDQLGCRDTRGAVEKHVGV